MLERFGGRPGPYIIGHRGASGYAPENTMVSFERALALRADAIELDIHPTSDGELVVIHDATLNRTTNGTGLVSAHTLAEIRELDAGSWFDPSFNDQRVPLLREVLEWIRGRAPVAIEIKQPLVPYPNIEELLVAELDRLDMRGNVLVLSFDHFSVKRVKELAPDIPTSVLYSGRVINPIALARDAGADSLMPHWTQMTHEDVAAAHEAGLLIWPWGGAEQDYHYIFSFDIDAVGADFPDRARLILEERTNDD